MSPHLQRYLKAVHDYCSEVTVLGWGLHPPGAEFNLDHVYVESEARPYEAYWGDPVRMDWDSADEPDESPQGPRQPQPPPPEPVLAVAEANPRLLLMGDPGLGKTTTLRYLAAHTADQCLSVGESLCRLPRRPTEPQLLLPILVELHRWQPADDLTESLREALPQPVPKATTDSAWQEVCNLLEAGRCRVLLDGLDEYRGDHDDVLKHLAPDSESAPASFILTSRPIPRPHTAGWAQVPMYFLHELKPDDVERLSERLCPDEPGRTRLRDFATGPGAALCRIPLFLAMMSRIADDRRTKEMPRTRAGAFDRFFRALQYWEREKPDTPETDQHPPLNPTHMRRALGPLALDIRLRRRDELHSDDTEEALRKHVGADNVHAALHYLTRLQILREVGPAYEFVYEVVLDYFAACGLAATPDPYHEVEHRIHWPGLREVIPMAAGLLPDIRLPFGWRLEDKLYWLSRTWALDWLTRAAARILKPFGRVAEAGTEAAQVLIESAQPEQDGPHWRHGRTYFIERILRAHSPFEECHNRDLGLALRCSWECDQLLPPVADRLAHKAVRALRRWPDVHGDERALSLATVGTRPEKAKELLRTLHVGAPMRMYVEASLEYGHDRSQLLELSGSLEPNARLEAALAMRYGKWAQDDELRECLLQLTRDEHDQIRAAAIEALEPIADDARVERRALALSGDAADDVRQAAVRVLGRTLAC